eukprot:2712246-Prorocentrum_lima.AAC.1
MRTATRKALVILAVGDTDAIYWHEEIFYKECRAHLVPVKTLGLVACGSGEKGPFGSGNVENKNM